MKIRQLTYQMAPVILVASQCLASGGTVFALQWRHNESIGVSNHQPHDCLLNRLFKAQIKEISKLRGTGFCEGNSPVTGEFPAQRDSNAENDSIWWRHHDKPLLPHY